MVNDFISALYAYYVVCIAVLVYLYNKKELNKQVTKVVLLFASPIIIFAYFKVFDYMDLFNKMKVILNLF